MQTHKWLSNSLKVLENIPSQYRASEVNFNDKEVSPIKTLGVLWLATEDVFTFKSYCITVNQQNETIFKMDCNTV